MTTAASPRDATQAVLLIAHGTVESLDDLPEFVTNIRRGHAPPPDLIAELRHRYEAIGGQSPLLAITRDVAAKLEARLGVKVRTAMRLWKPYPREVLDALASEGIRRVVVLPLAQHSAPIYAEAVRAAAEGAFDIAAADNWGQSPLLTAAFARELTKTVRDVPRDAWKTTTILLTAHSLPLFIIRGGDPYEREVRASAEAVMAAARAELGEGTPRHEVAFQSQGMGTGPGGKPIEWLGPDLLTALDAAKARGDTHVVVAPIGFLADHVEILYDLDIEAKAWAHERGLTLTRTASLNATEPFIETLAAVARPLLERS
jgi:ferrochelatase